jgi:tight adherence protein C
MYLFRGAQLALAIALTGVVFGLLTIVFKVGSQKAVFFAIGGGLLGVLVPSFWLDYYKKQRQATLRRALPDALDMIVLCLEGGISLTAAIQRVTDELQAAHPALAIEMGIVQREMQLGLSAGDALRKFADRYQLTDVQNLASVILQSEQFGASVVKALRVHADTSRQERQQYAEEMAQKATVKILFPTLLCIFPAIFIVILGPAAFQVAAMLAQMR